jgi:hypothetical protein
MIPNQRMRRSQYSPTIYSRWQHGFNNRELEQFGPGRSKKMPYRHSCHTLHHHPLHLRDKQR